MKKIKIFIMAAMIGILCNGCREQKEKIVFDVDDRREEVKLIEKGEGKDVCIVSNEGVGGDNIVLGKYMVLSSAKGDIEDIGNGGRISHYSHYELNLYDLNSGKLAKVIDVNKILEQEEEREYQVLETNDYNTAQIDKRDCVRIFLERIPDGKDDRWKTDWKYLNIDINTWDSFIMTTEEAHTKVKKDSAVEREMSIFDEWGEYSLKDANGFPSEKGKDGKEKYFYVSEYFGWEGITQVWMTTDYLPKENKALYSEFPQLKEYQGKEGLEACIYFSDYSSAEEIFKLFMEEGQEVAFDGAWLDGEHSIDGQEHLIHSFEEYYQWRK